LIEDESGLFQQALRFPSLTFTLGARLVYLPPYSPDFNPIEEAFSAIKASLRRNEQQFMNAEQIPWLITRAIHDITPDMAIRWFGDCGYL